MMLADLIPGNLPAAERESLELAYERLQQLPQEDCPLPVFSERFLELLVYLFPADGGAIWFRAPSERQLAPRAACGDSPWRAEPDSHAALMRFALMQSRSFLVAPYARVSSRSELRNPTDVPILLGPVESQGDRIAVVELFLGPSYEVPGAAESDARLARWLDHCLSFYASGLEQRFQGNLAPLQPALTNLEATRLEIEAYKEAIRVSLEVTINNYAGWNFGSLKNNQTFTRQVHELLDANGMRIACPECGAPAILRCQSAGNAKTGVFLYDHYLASGRTFHGGPTTFPKVQVVAKPPRRRKE